MYSEPDYEKYYEQDAEQRRGWSLHCSPALTLGESGTGIVGAECSACGEKTMRYPSRVKGIPARAGRSAPWGTSFVAQGGVGWVDIEVLIEWCDRHSKYTQARIAEWRESKRGLIEIVGEAKGGEGTIRGAGLKAENVAPRDLVMNAIQNTVGTGWRDTASELAKAIYEALEGPFEACYEAGQDSQWRVTDYGDEGWSKERFSEWWNTPGRG